MQMNKTYVVAMSLLALAGMVLFLVADSGELKVAGGALAACGWIGVIAGTRRKKV